MELQGPLRRNPRTEITADAIAALIASIKAAAKSGRHLSGTLPVPLPRNQGIHPAHSILNRAEFTFKFFAPTNGAVSVEDLLSEIQVVVAGELQIGGSRVAMEDHWRIDTQVKRDATKPPREAHPLFHYQRGGHAQDAFTNQPGFVPGPVLPAALGETRALMQYPGPRIAVSPVCPTAALDMVLSQHDGPLWRRLMDDPDYANVVRRCQDRLWILYAEGLADPVRRHSLVRNC